MLLVPNNGTLDKPLNSHPTSGTDRISIMHATQRGYYLKLGYQAADYR